MVDQDPSVTEVTAFYDEFLERRMLDYRLRPNKRLEIAFDALRKVIKDGSNVADIGCGIGIISEKIARKFPKSRVVGVDLSNANIAYAKRTITEPNIEFFAADVTDQIEVLRTANSKPFDIVFLIDVIEHVPETERAGLLADLGTIARTGAVLFLAYPSPEYQDFLRTNDPEELQVIDNNVVPEKLVCEAHAAGWKLREYAYKDVWRAGQYIHATFVKGHNEGELAPVPASVREKVAHRVVPALLRPLRYRKYISEPMKAPKP